mgnify:CR=1 FL=1
MLRLSQRSITIRAWWSTFAAVIVRDAQSNPVSGVQVTFAVTSGGGALTGVRVVDLTQMLSGPYATMLLADLGAEVIKVESTGYPDWWRGVSYSDAFYNEQLYEKSAYFNLMNRNKLGITLDLTRPEGRRLLLQLVERSVFAGPSNGGHHANHLLLERLIHG